MMYHHHIISRNENETIKKIYNKQKQQPTPGDWFQLLKKDFAFIGEEIDESMIMSTPKNEYKEKIKEKITRAAFD